MSGNNLQVSHNENESVSDGKDTIVGQSRVIKHIKWKLLKIAPYDCTALITGETGTGKELATQFIHNNSPRAGNALISINCAALPETLVESELFGYERGAFTGAATKNIGKFQLASKGTIFLDEVSEMNTMVQAKFLRLIEKKEVLPLGGKAMIPLNVRIIAATNKDLYSLVKSGRFREDLYFRLNVAHIHLPPLREYKDDIQYLAQHFLTRLNERYPNQKVNLTDEIIYYFVRYDWPGNVRELKNLIESAFINSSTGLITLKELPDMYQKYFKNLETGRWHESDRIRKALCESNWNKSEAARKLNCSRKTLYRKISRYRLSPDDLSSTSIK